jgi:hypothetical protein
MASFQGRPALAVRHIQHEGSNFYGLEALQWQPMGHTSISNRRSLLKYPRPGGW